MIKLIKEFGALTRRILHLANSGVPRLEFLQQVSDILLSFSGCEVLELRIKYGDLHYRWWARVHPDKASRFEVIPGLPAPDGRMLPCGAEDSVLERVCRQVLLSQFDASLPCFTKDGSFWSADLAALKQNAACSSWAEIALEDGCNSLAMIPFVISQADVGLVLFKSQQRDFFDQERIEFYEGVAQTLGMALADRRAQAALRERMKELACLYEISQITARNGLTLDDLLQRAVNLLPPAMQYPEHVAAQITLDARTFKTPTYRSSRHHLAADILVNEQLRGRVEVVYPEVLVVTELGLFLPEEQHLINAVARQLALIIERREAEVNNVELQEQLRHADRLATIGQLAAGVAHELNEPLSNILGYAQLLKKVPDLSAEAERDLDKIVTSSLHAREIIKKLLLFARQMPPSKTLVSLNQIVTDGLYLLDARFAHNSIELARRLAANLPEIVADPSQLHQVFVNLVVNAVQAMPAGGRLTIQTLALANEVALIVEDTGTGMSEEVKRQIFVPFFTTKDVGEGTGLGLSVVHGIVTAHGGAIRVESAPGQGARFEVWLPVHDAAVAKLKHDN